MSNLAVDLLIDKRIKLLQEQYEMNQKFNAEIGELNAAINQLRGNNAKEAITAQVYDDENPDYIRASQEEI